MAGNCKSVPGVCLNSVVLVSGKALAAVFSGISAMYTGGKEAVDLMESDPLRTVAEAKNVGIFSSITVRKGSDPIKSALG
jgi:hypothetical protein